MEDEIRASFMILNNLSEDCFTKCVVRLDQDSLTKREISCVNKCYDKNMAYMTNFKKFWINNNEEHATKDRTWKDGR